MYDVIVVGGGPTGSQVACKLAGMGHRVVVIEQKKDLTGPVCCTGIVGQECVKSFAIDDGVIFRRLNSGSVFAPSGKHLRLWRPEPQACILDRAAFNASMASRAQGRGVEYIWNSPVKSLEIGSDRAWLKVDIQGREPEVLQAQALVIAAGSASRLTEGMGLGRASDFAMAVQAEVETTCIDEAEVYLGRDIAPGFFAWLVPTSPARALVGLMSRRSPGSYLRGLLSSLYARGRIASAEVEMSYGVVALRPLARTYGDRLVVVGSAAGQVKPTTGGGIYYGLLCADIAAGVLHEALERDTLSARDLAAYEKAWKRALGWELKVGYWARRLYEALGDRQLDRIFDIISEDGMLDALVQTEDLSFDWHASAVLKLLGHHALSGVIKATRLPLPVKGRQ